MRDYGLLFVAVLAFGALAATFVGLAAIAGRESAARAAGYAAAVDSVRAVRPVKPAPFCPESPTWTPKRETFPLPSCCGGCHSSWVNVYRLERAR